MLTIYLASAWMETKNAYISTQSHRQSLVVSTMTIRYMTCQFTRGTSACPKSIWTRSTSTLTIARLLMLIWYRHWWSKWHKDLQTVFKQEDLITSISTVYWDSTSRTLLRIKVNLTMEASALTSTEAATTNMTTGDSLSSSLARTRAITISRIMAIKAITQKS